MADAVVLTFHATLYAVVVIGLSSMQYDVFCLDSSSFDGFALALAFVALLNM